MLCDICVHAFSSHGPIPRTAPEDAPFDELGYYEETQWLPHHPSFQSLKASVDLNCSLCAAFWKLQSQKVTTWLESEISGPGSRAHSQTSLTPAVDVTQPGTQLGVHTFMIKFVLLKRPSTYLSYQRILLDGFPMHGSKEVFNTWIKMILHLEDNFDTENIKQCSTSLECPQTFSQARLWIEECAKHHSACSSTSTWYPTRLLDSGPLEATEKVIVRLHETADASAVTKGPYMTLSYCWGTEAPLVLTKKTHSRLVSGIALDDLPKAFRDAICICRGLGVRYLWVDALCIFQDKDDEEEVADWQREASQMYKVYSNTLCNISAAAGVGSSSPILRSRPPDALRQDELTIQWLNQDKTTTTSCYCLLDTFSWLTEVLESPVNSRAWVLQERMLSPRIIHFTNSKMYWECFGTQTSELYPQLGSYAARMSSRYTYGTSKILPSKNNEGSQVTDQDSLRRHYEQWCLLVTMYSECGLTVPTDKLVAISAIARRMATYFQDDYIAGMWRKSLEHCLLWRRSRFHFSEVREPTIYVAPSWSWAATEGKVSLLGGNMPGGWPPGEGDRLYAVVEDVQLEYASDDVFGALRGGRLRLRGVLQRIQLLADFPEIEGLSAVELEKVHSEWFRANWGTHRVLINGKQTPYRVILDRNPFKRYEKENRDGLLFCMLVYRFSDRVLDTWTFLLLEVVKASDGTFRRIGTTNLPWGVKYEEVALSRHEDEGSFPCVEYKDGEHSIWII